MTTHDRTSLSGGDLIARVTEGSEIKLGGEGESVWLEVIHKMDEVYSDLLRYETDLERKNAELEEAQAFISSVIASVSDILVVVDGEGLIQQVNPAFLRLTGRKEAELLGHPLVAFMAGEDREAMAARACICEGRAEWQMELRFETPAGPSDLMALSCSMRLDHMGHRVGSVVTGRPIGELRRAYEALHAAHLDLQSAQRKLIEQEKMASLGRLVAGVAHELNNPISFVYGNVHTLDRYRKRLADYVAALHGGASTTQARELRRSLRIDALLADLQPLLEGTLEGAARVSEIVRNLRRLSFSRPGERQPVLLEKVIHTACHWASRSKKTQVEIDLSLDPELTVEAHEGQIHQVVVNLIDNAIDAVREAPQPRIRIALFRRGGEAVLTVSDNGPGIPPVIQDKIFEPFFTTKTVGEGTGLGLWISYSILREHSGGITLASTVGEGSVFTVTLPLAAGGAGGAG